jgi:hypothetical protein
VQFATENGCGQRNTKKANYLGSHRDALEIQACQGEEEIQACQDQEEIQAFLVVAGNQAFLALACQASCQALASAHHHQAQLSRTANWIINKSQRPFAY